MVSQIYLIISARPLKYQIIEILRPGPYTLGLRKVQIEGSNASVSISGYLLWLMRFKKLGTRQDADITNIGISRIRPKSTFFEKTSVDLLEMLKLVKLIILFWRYY